MSALLRPFRSRRTYSELLYLLASGPVAAAWFGLLLAGWLVVAILAITPLLVPALLSFRAATRLAAQGEAGLARALLGIDVQVGPHRRIRAGYWGLIRRSLGDAVFWRQQAYLALRTVLGFGTAVATVSSVGYGAVLTSLPITYRWVDESYGSWHIDSLSRAFLLLPGGILILLVSVHLVHPVAGAWSRAARALLDEPGAHERHAVHLPTVPLRRALFAHASLFVALNLLLIVIWALTTRAYFWPEWTLMPLGTVLAIHAWVVWVLEHDEFRVAHNVGLTIHLGVTSALFLFFVGVWAVTTRGYFWPVWPALAFVLAAAVHAVVALTTTRDRALTERIDALTASRAGAVDVSESALQRIERDLHDGAQARLVSLGINLGMVEQKLGADPEAARRLVAEARAGVGEALKELRDLTRGIRPPILTDRGLEAAVAGLAAASPLDVDVVASVTTRPAVPVETAAYFVVAEALANASKHAAAEHVTVSLLREPDRLLVTVSDDGRGGADPAGAGLTGLRQRVEALDGTLTVTSPPGGPTTIEAVLPCAS